MPATVIALSSVHSDRLASVDTERSERPAALRAIPTVSALEDRATRELAAYFARSRGAAAPDAAADDGVEAVLASISAYHRGVLTLHEDFRGWPAAVRQALGGYTGIGLRLYCADHPAEGSTPALEKAAAERIAAIYAADGSLSPTLLKLQRRARGHHRQALRAYVKALAAREVQLA